MFMRKLAILAKIESVYNTDAVPTGAANAILARNVEVVPLEVQEEERDLIQPWLGNVGAIVTAFYGSLSYEVEIAGASAAGTVPKYGPLFRGCALAEAVSAGVSVTYTPVSTGFESLTQYFYLDGVLHKFTGTRGSVSLTFNARAIPLYKFTFMGIFVPVTDAALPTAVYTGFVAPLAVNKVNTPTFTVHTIAAVCKSLTLDLANDVQYRNLVNYEGVEIVDRKPGGSIEFEANLMATKNWFSTARDKTTGVLNIVHGTVAGNIVQVTVPNAQINAPKYGEDQGVAMISAGLSLIPGSAGNDEISIIVK